VKSFAARFRINQRDPRLLPDLSASLEIAIPSPDLRTSVNGEVEAVNSKRPPGGIR